MLSKMGMYDINIQGTMVKVSVVDNSSVVDAKIDELKSLLQTLQKRVVGFDVKILKNRKANLMLLCVGTRCLIIQLCHLDRIPESLKQFLADQTICFLGTGMAKINRVLIDDKNIDCWSCVEVGHFAARILKKEFLEYYGLPKLAGLVGMDIKELITEHPDWIWNSRMLSEEHIKYAIHNAYSSYVIGNKLLNMLHGS
uniref:3'-5' exonuclease domain-containing protein n=1 Tax=Fagus sylvatica TaxID=28930 RepID=A0A2N9FJQ7_FAGSY